MKRQFKLLTSRTTVTIVFLAALLLLFVMNVGASPDLIDGQNSQSFTNIGGINLTAVDQAPPNQMKNQEASTLVNAAQSRTVTYSYAPNGRLRSADYGNGVKLFYNYDPAGNLNWVSDHLSTFLPLIIRQ